MGGLLLWVCGKQTSPLARFATAAGSGADIRGSVQKRDEAGDQFTIAAGQTSKCLAVSIHGTLNPPEGSFVNTIPFMGALAARLRQEMGA